MHFQDQENGTIRTYPTFVPPVTNDDNEVLIVNQVSLLAYKKHKKQIPSQLNCFSPTAQRPWSCLTPKQSTILETQKTNLYPPQRNHKQARSLVKTLHYN